MTSPSRRGFISSISKTLFSSSAARERDRERERERQVRECEGLREWTREHGKRRETLAETTGRDDDHRGRISEEGSLGDDGTRESCEDENEDSQSIERGTVDGLL